MTVTEPDFAAVQKKMPIAPLLEFIEIRAAAAGETPSTYVCKQFGGRRSKFYRQYSRMVERRTHGKISQYVADEWAAWLGVHASSIWTDEWFSNVPPAAKAS